MHAIVLAAGYGTRLKEVGERLPKGLLEFNETNLITLAVNELRTMKVEKIAVVTNNKYFEQYKIWNEKQNQPTILINDGTNSPENRLGALGDFCFAIEKLGWENEGILMSPSDTYFAFSLKEFQKVIDKHPREMATIVRKMRREDIQNRLGCAVLSETGQIIEFVEKPADPPSPYAAIPFYYYPKEIHRLLTNYQAEGNSMDAPGNIVPWMMKNKLPVHAYVAQEETIDVGTLKELELLKKVG